MNDRLDTTITDISGDADDRIDAMARTAGHALRRSPSADQLVRIHRAKRNHQIARATGGAAAVLALVGGGLLLANRGQDDVLVPATLPTTAPQPTTPTTAGPTTPPTSNPPTSNPVTPTVPVTNPPDSAPPTSPPGVGAGEQPEFFYVGNPLTGDLSEQVVDPATGEVVRTQDRNGTPYLNNWQERLTRRDSAEQGITYDVQGFEDLGQGDFIDYCGQGKVVIENGPTGGTALPERAMSVTVSPDGRWVVVMSTTCPRDGALVPGVGVPADMPAYDVQVEVFDADDPAAAGRPLTTFTTAVALLPQVRYSADGHWMALSGLGEDSGRGLEVYDLETAAAVDLGRSGDECTTLAYANQDALFVDDDTIAELRRCFDQVVVQITDLADPANTAQISVTNLGTNNDPWGTLEVWPNVPADVRQATFVASVGTIGVLDSGQTFYVTGGEVTQLPFDATHISFSPLPQFIGGS